MRTKNHFLLKLVLASFIYFFSTNSNAAATFAKLEDCRVAYLQSHTPTQDFKVVDKWCEPQMDPVTFCADRAYLNEIALNSYTQTAAKTLRSTLQQQCAVQANLANQNGTGGLVGTGTGVPTSANGVSLAACAGGANTQACLQAQQQNQVATAAQQQQAIAQQQAAAQQAAANSSGSSGGGNVYSAASQAIGQAAQLYALTNQQTQPQNNQAQQPTQATNSGNQAGSVQQTPTGGGASASPSLPNGNVAGATASGGNNSDTSRVIASNNSDSTASAQSNVTENGLTRPPTASELQNAATEVRQDMPGGERQVDGVAGTSGNAEETAPGETQLTSAAQQRQTEMNQALDSAKLEAIKFVRSKQFEKVLSSLESAKTKYQKFIETKNSCVKNAERTNKLCLEGTSPGMKAAKALVDYSGPVLSAIASAQKACSSTKKVMNLAAMGMTLAKTACVASKAMCDGTCTRAETQLREVVDELVKASNEIRTDAENISNYQKNRSCQLPPVAPSTEPTQDPACFPEVETAGNQLFTKLNNAKQIIDREVHVEPGTTQTMVTSCNEKSKDILLMVANIGGVVLARAGAEKCEKKLASASGTGGTSNVSTAEYCSKAENRGTQFCKCQGNLTGPECSTLAGLSNNSDPAASQMGANLKPTSGLSSFAGAGNSGSGSGSNYNLSGGLNGEAGSAAGMQGLNGISNGSGNAPGSFGSGGGGGGSANASADNTANAANAKAEEKKWSFGSFASALSGLVGGKGSSSGNSGNGSASPEQQQAIARKIASDRFAAEVSPSSGLDNFSKIKKSYFRRADTFMNNP